MSVITKTEEAQKVLEALYEERLVTRSSDRSPVFELKEVKGDGRPVLIQCCIR